MIKVFDIPPIVEKIEEAISLGQEPDPALVNLLIQEGPACIESWIDAIEVVKVEADIIKKRIEELKERREARLHTAERMSDLLASVLENHFEGKVKTPTLTTWVQPTISYDFGGSIPKSYFVTPEPRLDKKRLMADHKEGKLPKGIEVTENVSRSIRVRR